MVDYKDGSKKQVAEIKFLIHDLRVENFINDIIHFHVTLNTDLEIFNVDQARALHDDDLQKLKTKAAGLRRDFQTYINSVKSFSPDKTIIAAGMKYIETIRDMAELILNPLWGRIDTILSFLPEESRSFRSRSHYRNSLLWVCGVYYRIEYFMIELANKEMNEDFDIGDDVYDFTRNIIYGYATEKGKSRIEMQFGRLDSVVIVGNRPRFRRMYFNLVMNSVDSLQHKKVGMIKINIIVQGERVLLQVQDDGIGMSPEKIHQLLGEKESLDGELHSLGFVFVRQTVGEFNGELSIESSEGGGTTMTVSFPFTPGKKAPPRRPSRCEKYLSEIGESPFPPRESLLGRAVAATASSSVAGSRAAGSQAAGSQAAGSQERDLPASPSPGAENNSALGEIVFKDYQKSESPFPGCIFAVAVTERDEVDFFTHRPYEKYWNISHEDLSPMFFQATVRGRLEENDEKIPELILKAPQNVGEYFEFKNVPRETRAPAKFIQMMHDEYISIARKLIETGLAPEIAVYLTDLKKFFPEDPFPQEPFELKALAGEKLSVE